MKRPNWFILFVYPRIKLSQYKLKKTRPEQYLASRPPIEETLSDRIICLLSVSFRKQRAWRLFEPQLAWPDVL